MLYQPDALPEQVREIDRVAATFVERLDGQYLAICERNHVFPIDAWRSLVAAGLLEVVIDEGSGIRWQATTAVVCQIARKSTALANSFVAAGTGIELLRRLGHVVYQQEVAAMEASGRRYGFAFTEPDAGQDLLGTLRSTVRDGDDGTLLLDGRKIFSTGSADADITFVLAVDQTVGSLDRGLAVVALDPRLPGVAARRLDLMSFHSLPSYELVFDDVAISVADVVRGPDLWRRVASVMTFERLSTAAMAVGLAGTAFETARVYAQERRAFGGSIGRFQAIQHALADSYIDLKQAVLMCFDAATAADRGADIDLASTAAKLAATEAAVRVTERSMRILGGYGVSSEYAVERCFRDVRPLVIGPITNEMGRNIIGRHLGLERSY